MLFVPPSPNMKNRTTNQLLLILIAASLLVGCANNPFNPNDRRRSPQDQSQDRAYSDTPSGPVCASAVDCGISQNAPGHPPSAITYNSQVRKQLEFVGKELALTPKQTVLWDNYMAKLSALISDQSDPNKSLPTLDSAPRQIQRKLDIARDRYTAVEDVSESAIKLYQSLTEDQKRTADKILPLVIPSLYASIGDSSPGTNSQSPQDVLGPGTRNSSGYGKRRGGNSGSWGSGSGLSN